MGLKRSILGLTPNTSNMQLHEEEKLRVEEEVASFVRAAELNARIAAARWSTRPAS